MASKITIPRLDSQISKLEKFEVQQAPRSAILYANAFLRIADAIKTRNDADDRAKAAADAARSAYPSDGTDAPEPGYSSESDRVPPARGRQVYPVDALYDQLRRKAEERRQQRKQFVDDALNDLADSAYKDPSAIGDYRDQADGIFGVLDDEEREVYASERRRINEQYFRGLIRDNPKAALEMLRSRAGVAEKELGISEETREDLEATAQRAFDAEQNGVEAETHVQLLDTLVGLKVYTVAPEKNPGEIWRGYHNIIEAYDFDAKSAERLEPQFDKTVREAQTHAKVVFKAADKILTGKTIDRDRIEHADAVDTFAKAVVGEDTWTPFARWRMAWIARAANHAPDFVREHIRNGVHARDAGKRAFAGRLLIDLEDTHDLEHGLLDWAPLDIRAFGRAFGALIDAGFSDDVAVTRIDAGKSLTPERQESRRHAFHVRLDGAAFWDTLREAFEIRPRDLLYRPEHGKIVEDRRPYVDDGRAKAVELDYGNLGA